MVKVKCVSLSSFMFSSSLSVILETGVVDMEYGFWVYIWVYIYSSYISMTKTTKTILVMCALALASA